MFHVEQDKIYIETKDYLFSNEKFQIINTDLKGLLKTAPQPRKENIKKYYNTKAVSYTHLTLPTILLV